MKTPDNPPVFAVATESDWQGGINLRDWFAGQALAGMLCAADWNSEGGQSLFRATNNEDIAQASYMLADAMLAEREKRG